MGNGKKIYTGPSPEDLYYYVPITQDIRDRAIARLKPTFKNSYHDGKGTIWGNIGEELVLKTLGKRSKFIDCRDFDILYNGNIKLDVKTKTRAGAPLPKYDGMVLESQMHQKTDFYIHVQVMAPRNLKNFSMEEIRNVKFEHAYIIGTISKSEFVKNSRFNKVGEFAPNGVEWEENAYTIPYGELTKFPKRDGIVNPKE